MNFCNNSYTHMFCCTIYYFFNFQTIVHHTNAFTYISLLTIVDLHSPISQIDIKNYHHSGGNPTIYILFIHFLVFCFQNLFVKFKLLIFGYYERSSLRFLCCNGSCAHSFHKGGFWKNLP